MAELGDKRVDLKDLKVLSDYMKEVYATKLQVGGPLKASAAADMTDTDRVYIYTGSETGYTAGGWYYYDGAAWSLGGIYQSDGVETDTTLTLPGEAADAAAVGAAVTGIMDGTLSVPGKAADAETVGDVLLKYNSWNIVANPPTNEVTSYGVTFTWNGNGYTVNGSNTTTSSMSYRYLAGTSTTLPRGIEAGKSYLFRCTRSTNSVKFGVLLNRPGMSAYTTLLPNDATELLISIPADTVGCRICVRVNAGVTVTNETITDLVVLNAKTNRELDEKLASVAADQPHVFRSLSTSEVSSITAANFPFGRYFSALGASIISIFGSTGFDFDVSTDSSYFVLSYETRNSGWVVKGMVDIIRPNGTEHYHGSKTVNAQSGVESWTWRDQSWTNVEQIESDVSLMQEEDKPVYEYYGEFEDIPGWYNYAGNVAYDEEGTNYYHSNLLKVRGGVTYYSGYLSTGSTAVGCIFDKRKNKIGPLLSPVPTFDAEKNYAAYTYVKYDGDYYMVRSGGHSAGPWDANDFSLRTNVIEVTAVPPAYRFSETIRYTKGKNVYYDGEYYKFNTVHEAGPWLGTDVDVVGVGYIPDQAGNDEPDYSRFPIGGFITVYKYTMPENAAYVSINLALKRYRGPETGPDTLYYSHLNSATLFDPNETYTGGQYVVYGHTQASSISTDKLYLVKSNGHSGAWNAADFTVQYPSEYSRYRQYVSSKDNYMAYGTGNIVIRDTDAFYQRYKNKKLCVIGPSPVAIDRAMREGTYYIEEEEEKPRMVNTGTEYREYYDKIVSADYAYNNDNTKHPGVITKIDNRKRAQRGYIAGFQEYLKPYFADVKCFGYSGAPYPYARGSEQKCSIYTRICGGQETVTWKVAVSEFSPSKTYETGTYTLYGGEYYVFVNEHTGAWNPDDVELTDQETATTRSRSYDLPGIDLSDYDVFYILANGNGVQGKDYDADYKSRDKNYYTGAVRLIVEKILNDNHKAQIYLATRRESIELFKYLNVQIRMLQKELCCGLVDTARFSLQTPAYSSALYTYDNKHHNNEGNQLHAYRLQNAIMYGLLSDPPIDGNLREAGAAADAGVTAEMIEQTVNGTLNTPIVITDASNKQIKTATMYMDVQRESDDTPSPSHENRFVSYTGVKIVVSPTDDEDAAGSVAYTIDWNDEIGPSFYGSFNPVTGTLYRRPVYDPYDGETLPGEWRSSMDPYVAGTTPTIGAQVIDLGTPGETVQVDMSTIDPKLLETLKGENHITVYNYDPDDPDKPGRIRMNLTYRCDTKLYIDARIAEIQG